MLELNVLIADDEPIARDILLAYCAKIPAIKVVATCKNAIEVISELNKADIDLMLLDINMPEISGTDLLKTLRNPPPAIFTTAYSEYAVESYEMDALDYLLKPFSFDRFAKAINKAIEKKETSNNTENDTSVTDRTLFIKSDGKLVKIDLAELHLIEGVKDYVKLWVGDQSYMVHSTMKNMEEQLAADKNMLRVHKSYIVNISHIQEVDGNMLRLGNQTVVVGNTYKDAFSEAFSRYRLIS